MTWKGGLRRDAWKVERAMSKFLADKQVADQLQVSLSAVRRWRGEGKGPRFVKLGQARSRGALVRYDSEAVTAWITSLPTGGSGQEAAA